MTRRERVEDLGIILEKITALGEHELFDRYKGRNKDFLDWWDKLDRDQQREFLYSLPYDLEAIHNDIMSIWEIALGDEEDRT